MTKFISFISCGALLLSLAGCGDKKQNANSNNSDYSASVSSSSSKSSNNSSQQQNNSATAKLSVATLTPQQTVGAIINYETNEHSSGKLLTSWKALKGTDKINVVISNDFHASGHQTEPGEEGVTYFVTTGSQGTGDPKAAYTINHGKIFIYDAEDGETDDAGNDTPLETITKDDIVNFANGTFSWSNANNQKQTSRNSVANVTAIAGRTTLTDARK